jgi:hypothetical protein
VPCKHKVRQHQFLFRVYPSLAPEFTPCGSVFLIFLMFCVVLLCVLTFVVPCFDVRYDIHIKEMFYSSLPPVVCMTLMSYCVFCVFPHSDVQHFILSYVFTFWVPCWVVQNFVLSYVFTFWVRVEISYKNDVRFVFTSRCTQEAHVLFTLFVFVCMWWCPTHIDYINNILVYYKRQELLPFANHRNPTHQKDIKLWI